MRKEIDCEVIEDIRTRVSGLLIRVHEIPSSVHPGDIIEFVSEGDTVAKVCAVPKISVSEAGYPCEGCWGYTHITASTFCQALCGYRCRLKEIPDIMEDL